MDMLAAGKKATIWYSPAYEFNWDEFMAHKRRGGSIKDFENKNYSLLRPCD